jgi:hypothetical protein
MLLFKLISMTEVIPRSLFVTNITNLESISVGGFGRVFEGLYEGKPVAVKMLYHACHEVRSFTFTSSPFPLIVA